MITITWTNAQQKAAGMGALAERVGTHHAYEWAEEVAEVGEKTIEAIARVDTGWMRGSVGKIATAMGGVGVATAGYGAQMASPFYTKFQEFGTRHGIKPMGSLIAGSQAMSVESSNAGDKMLANIAAEWNAI